MQKILENTAKIIRKQSENCSKAARAVWNSQKSLQESKMVQDYPKALRNQWVYVLITADLERTIWAQDAVNLIRSWIEV